MKPSKKSLQRIFFRRMFIILVVVMLVSGFFQLYFIQKQVDSEVQTQTNIIATTIYEGISETRTASQQIEEQIGDKLMLHAEHIANLIEKEGLSVSNERLMQIAKDYHLAGVTLFSPRNKDIVGIKAARSEEVGFSFKQYGYLEAGEALINGQIPHVPGATTSRKNMLVLPIAQAGSVKGKPQFFKFAYFHPPGKNYIISVYLPANEVHEFTSKVGPERTIDKMQKENNNVNNIAVLDPEVFQHPQLEQQLYPPKKKVVYGSFKEPTSKDLKVLTEKSTKFKGNYTEVQNGKKVVKIFIPIKENLIIYIELDWNKLIGPLYRHSIILLISGFVSLIVLFYFSAKFFNEIYIKINMIKEQLTALRNKNFQTRSRIVDDTEIGVLSNSANEMAASLSQVLRSARNQADQTKRLSFLLEADIAKSIKELYELSVDNTTKAREELEMYRELVDSIKANDSNNEQELNKLWMMIQNNTAGTTDVTITLSNIIQSLHDQSNELLNLSEELHNQLAAFKL
ncbi:methyl-accepting chemotaxis protein [Fictibacillus enclensis]|uniref:HAMP domain-containing protein n=1 Tax=Fictibacillus enclensis TaxID=1017270 RepID=UPI0025A20FD2|nr:methyl-accepting chemotaxis protein [Fictibacillus enclensis]MDM5335753.1 methyl-accepting chemotaxis protein [Fictibacillus enclensis]